MREIAQQSLLSREVRNTGREAGFGNWSLIVVLAHTTCAEDFGDDLCRPAVATAVADGILVLVASLRRGKSVLDLGQPFEVTSSLYIATPAQDEGTGSQ